MKMLDFSSQEPLPGALRYDDKFCTDYSNYLAANPVSYTLISLYVILFFTSSILLIFVAQTILQNKSLQAHPQMLIAYICMAEACMSWNALI